MIQYDKRLLKQIPYIKKNQIGIAILIFGQAFSIALLYLMFGKIGLVTGLITLTLAWLTMIYIKE